MFCLTPKGATPIFALLPTMDTEPTTPEITEKSQEPEHVPLQGRPLEVRVDDRGVERAIRKLRRLMASEGILREIKRRRHYEKPSIKAKRKEREADRRRKRRQRKLRQERSEAR